MEGARQYVLDQKLLKEMRRRHADPSSHVSSVGTTPLRSMPLTRVLVVSDPDGIDSK